MKLTPALLLLFVGLLLIDARSNIFRSKIDKITKKSRGGSDSDSDSNTDTKTDAKAKTEAFLIVNEPGDEKCETGGGYCVANQPLQCYGPTANEKGLCAGDRVCCSPYKCLTNRRFGVCKPTGNCDKGAGEQSVAGVCTDKDNFECCLHPLMEVNPDSSKTVDITGCGVYTGATIFYYIGNSGQPLEVVKIHREFLADQANYDKDPTEADNTVSVGTACAIGQLDASAQLNHAKIQITRGFRTLTHQDFVYNCFENKLSCYDAKNAATGEATPPLPGHSLYGDANTVEFVGDDASLKWISDNISYYGFRITGQKNVYQHLPSVGQLV
jgi:hypothetical protein